MKEVRDLFHKAARSFEAAKMLLENGDTDFAASRAYYGYFYVAEALLLHIGLNFSRHGQVIAQYGLHFAKTEKLPPRYHRAMIQTFSLRQAGDYGTAPDLNAGKVRELIEEGKISSKPPEATSTGRTRKTGKVDPLDAEAHAPGGVPNRQLV